MRVSVGEEPLPPGFVDPPYVFDNSHRMLPDPLPLPLPSPTKSSPIDSERRIVVSPTIFFYAEMSMELLERVVAHYESLICSAERLYYENDKAFMQATDPKLKTEFHITREYYRQFWWNSKSILLLPTRILKKKRWMKNNVLKRSWSRLSKPDFQLQQHGFKDRQTLHETIMAVSYVTEQEKITSWAEFHDAVVLYNCFKEIYKHPFLCPCMKNQ